jgi:hypothetical protein
MTVSLRINNYGKTSVVGCLKSFRGKAFEVLRKEAYVEVRRTDEG